MAEPKVDKKKSKPVCFVIMPISDVETYLPGHFRRVYDHLIVPSCEKAGFDPLLASDVKPTNMIVVDVLQRLHSAEMVLCDLSNRNPNVLFELGFRQAFNKPVTLIKDQRTERIFDISGLRDIVYDESLRIDSAQETILEIAARLSATFEASETRAGGVNSLVQLLNVEAAVIPERSQLSGETQIVLDAIRDVSDRVRALEPVRVHSASTKRALPPFKILRLLVDGTTGSAGELAERLRNVAGMLRVSVEESQGQTVITGWVRGDIEQENFDVLVARFAADIGGINHIEHRWQSIAL